MTLYALERTSTKLFDGQKNDLLAEDRSGYLVNMIVVEGKELWRDVGGLVFGFGVIAVFISREARFCQFLVVRGTRVLSRVLVG